MACICPISIPDKVLSRFGFKNQSILVPCGHCVGCAHDKVNDWFVRLYSVYQDFVRRDEPVWFVTVTIDPKLWPGMTRDSEGVRERITPWMRSWNERLRYLNGGEMPKRFLCSEFGSLGEKYFDKYGVLRITTGALHFHGFLFGYLPIKHIVSGLALTHGHVDFERIRSAACIRYAVKYATKDYSISDPLLRSRVFCSPRLGDSTFYFGESQPTSFVMINGFHYRCPRYLIEKQWIHLYGKESFFDAFGRSRIVISNAMRRIDANRRCYKDVDYYLSCGSSAYRWYLSGVQKSSFDPFDVFKVDKLLLLNRVGSGHPLLRHRDLVVSDDRYRNSLSSDRSFEQFNLFYHLNNLNHLNQFHYEGYQTFLSFSEDFET